MMDIDMGRDELVWRQKAAIDAQGTELRCDRVQ